MVFRENIGDFTDMHNEKQIDLEVTFKRHRFGYWNSCKRLPNFVNVAALKDGESYTLNNLYYYTSHDNSDCNWLTHVKDILTCSCLVAQCIDKDGESYTLNNLYYHTSHDNSDCNWLSHAKDILTCSCLVAQCIDKDGESYILLYRVHTGF